MERVLAGKVNWLAEHGYKVYVVTTDQRGRRSAFWMDPSVEFFDLGINYDENNGGSFISKLVRYPFKQLRHRVRLRALLKRLAPDVTVSMFCNEASFLPGIRFGGKKVLEIHFSRFKRLQYGRSGIWALADRLRYRAEERTASRYDKFVVLTEEDRGYWGDMPNICVIPNARPFVFAQPSDCQQKQVIAAGRYCHQKGFDMLLDAWKKVRSDGWTLRIAGNGESLDDVPGNVITGPSMDIRKEYLESSIYAMSSRYEGLPMVLLEAQSAGLPIVSFRCKCGPSDVVEDGITGYLVPDGDVDALAAKLQYLMDNDEVRAAMGKAAYAASDRYETNKIMSRWTDLFAKL